MKRFFTFFILMIVCAGLSAQETGSKKTRTFKSRVKEKATWERSASFALFAGQAGSKNWASGSDYFSLSANAFFHAHANRTRGRWYWNNNLELSYGAIWSDEYTTIKNDDKIDYLSTVGFKSTTKKNIGYAAALNVRTQFSSGYDRDYLNQGLLRRTSGFFAPGYITLAPFGIQWQTKHVDVYVAPVAGRLVAVTNAPYSYRYQGGVIPGNFVNAKNPDTKERSLAEMYDVDPAKEVQMQLGPYVSAGYHTLVTKNVKLNGRLDIFSDLLHNNPENLDVFWTNTFTLQVNNWLNVLYSLDGAYDENIKKFGYFGNESSIQIKSILGVGINANLWGKYKKMSSTK